jgi:hypothetical protein
LDREECWCRIFRFNWLGHQSRFDVPRAPDIIIGLFFSSM